MPTLSEISSLHELTQLIAAVDKGRVRQLQGLPYPVQFQNRGAYDAWRCAVEDTTKWARWNDVGCSCHDLRTEMGWLVDRVAAHMVDPHVAQQWRRRYEFAAMECSTNLLFEIRKGVLKTSG
jgi:hypothetical protein